MGRGGQRGPRPDIKKDGKPRKRHWEWNTKEKERKEELKAKQVHREVFFDIGQPSEMAYPDKCEGQIGIDNY